MLKSIIFPECTLSYIRKTKKNSTIKAGVNRQQAYLQIRNLCVHMMKLLPILLTILSCSASADWLLFSKADNGDKHYVDLSKMQTNNHLVSILFLVNFGQTGNNGLFSNQIHEEFDCSKEHVRLLSLTGHSEHFASGSVLHTQNTPSDWTHIFPETPLYERFLIACR